MKGPGGKQHLHSFLSPAWIGKNLLILLGNPATSELAILTELSRLLRKITHFHLQGIRPNGWTSRCRNCPALKDTVLQQAVHCRVSNFVGVLAASGTTTVRTPGAPATPTKLFGQTTRCLCFYNVNNPKHSQHHKDPVVIPLHVSARAVHPQA
jgi:hypothetical protein